LQIAAVVAIGERIIASSIAPREVDVPFSGIGATRVREPPEASTLSARSVTLHVELKWGPMTGVPYRLIRVTFVGKC
jgi:hypothetical protein